MPRREPRVRTSAIPSGVSLTSALLALPGGLTLTVASCGETPAGDVPATVRDSAGVRIVENGPLPRETGPWRLDPEPLFRVGWREEVDPILESVTYGAILATGDFAALDTGARILYTLAPDGTILHRFGRPGEGPGEFGFLRGMIALGGDTVLVQDGGNRRLHVLVDGEHVGEVRLPAELARQSVVGRDDTGGLLLRTVAFSMPPDLEPGWIEGPVMRASMDLSTTDTVALLGMIEFRGRDDANPFRASGTPGAAGGSVVYARTDRPEVRWLADDGSATLIARWEPRWIDDIEEHLEDLLARWEEEVEAPADYMADLAERARRDAEGPLPLFGPLVGDALGNVWLGEYPGFDRSPERYRVFGADGVVKGAVTVPPRLRILDIGPDVLLGVETDPLDVPAIVAYRIRKG